MNITLNIQDDTAQYRISDLDPAHHTVAQKMGFTLSDKGFARAFPAHAPYLEQAYHNFQKYAETIILQKAGIIPNNWEAALMTFLKLVDHRSVEWYLIGSGALAVRGIDLVPGDLDLVTGESDALLLAELAEDYLIEPIRDVTGWVGRWFVRTYMGTVVEWLGGVNESADAHGTTEFSLTALQRMETIEWRGYPIRVPPLDLQLEVNEQRGRAEVAAKIRAALSH